MDLTPKQKAFADEYIKNGGNASDAARKAGYSEKTAYSMGHSSTRLWMVLLTRIPATFVMPTRI